MSNIYERMDLVESKIDRIESVLNKINFGDPEIKPDNTGYKKFVDTCLKKAAETVHNIDIFNKPENPEIIGDYMHYRGEDYYLIDDRFDIECELCELERCIDCLNCEKGKSWKNIKDITIDDELAKLRPWVKWGNNDEPFILFATNGVHSLIGKIINDIIYDNHLPNTKHLSIATTADLKKAGITE